MDSEIVVWFDKCTYIGIFILQCLTDHLLCTSLLRHRLPDFSGRSVLRALLHHDVAHYG